MNREEKQQEIESLGKQFSESTIALCADYRGLTVEQITNLRRELRSVDAKGKVVKNTLAKLSVEKSYAEAEKAELDKFLAIFQGPNLVIFGKSDPISSAKALSKFAKDHEQLELKGGWFEGSFIDDKGIKALADLPSREELLGKLLSLMNAPATQLVQLLSAPARQVVQVLGAHKANLEKNQ